MTTALPRWYRPRKLDSRIWHNSIIPFARQIARAERRGDRALSALLRELEAERTAFARGEQTVEQAMHELLRTLHAEGTQPVHVSASPNVQVAFWTLLQRGTVNASGGVVTLADDLREMDVELLCLMHGGYPTLEDLDIDAGVGGVRDTVRSLLERGRGS
ncbi:Uncharacterised protein [Mycobacteroides abscessus subsp. abscessus]|uniref:hypothetical protein n=1 Tax=Mycobacteroides abscessus TaxID=36809 RepID=UPI00092BA147|nr:hypothetical protein [Mycobacteroides abscessus]SIC64097.1 Uncharacterised protein [Mycobacteroides abscessus subsp. abscessus]SIG65068.1 Uncharacterised protein [Mycobacteroides abscessus subsp. abscessus]